MRHHGRHIQNCHISPRLHIIVIAHFRMYLTQIPQHTAFINHIRLSARMQEIPAGVGIIGELPAQADAVEELLDDALHRKEITVAVHTECKLHPLVGQFRQRQRLRHVNIAQLIETHILVSSIIIGRQTGQHTM